MNAFFGLLSLLIFFVCIIGLIYSVFKKKPKKKWGIGLIVAVIVLFVCVVTDTDKKETTTSEQQLITEQQSESAKELTVEEQKQLLINWFDNIKDILKTQDIAMQPFEKTIIDIQNKNITDEEAINNAKKTQENLIILEQKINNLKAPEGLSVENKKEIDKSILELKNGITAQKDAIQLFIDGINNVDKNKLTQSISKFKISKEYYSNAMTNLGSLYGKLNIDVNSLVKDTIK